MTLIDSRLQSVDGSFLIRTEEAEPIGFDESGAFGFVSPRSLGGISGSLSEDNIVVIN